MPAVRAKYPTVRCIIAGSGDLAPELAAQVHTLGLEETVCSPGHLAWQETPDFFALCDAVVIPSVQDQRGNVDGLPNVLLEAMASGRAVLASRAAGMDGVIQDGVNGLLTDARG